MRTLLIAAALGVEHFDAQAVESNRSPTAGTRPRCDSR